MFLSVKFCLTQRVLFKPLNYIPSNSFFQVSFGVFQAHFQPFSENSFNKASVFAPRAYFPEIVPAARRIFRLPKTPPLRDPAAIRRDPAPAVTVDLARAFLYNIRNGNSSGI